MPEPKTAREFRAWPEEERVYLLQSGGVSRYGFIHHQELINVDETLRSLDPKSDLAIALKKAKEHLESKIDLNVDPEYGDLSLILIGKVRASANVYRHADGEILGIDLTVTQKGAMYPDEADSNNIIDNAVRESRKRYFDSLKEAQAAGADESDVSWTAGTTLEFRNGKLVDHGTSEYMEWTGF
jgi:hypothetical protein